jgi:RNA polymerase-binding transcription factor DksA
MPLTAAELKSFDQRLQAREAELTAEIDRASSEVKSDFERAAEREVGDDAAKYAAHENVSVERAEIGRDQQELREVRAARRRIAVGAYGPCVDCGAPIQTPRLIAQPAALRCTACQALFERG